MSTTFAERSLVLLAILFLWGGESFAQTPSPVILSVSFTGDVPSETRSLGASVQSLEGKPYSAFAVRTAIEDLYRTGLFAQVEAFATDEPSGVRLRFHLTGKTRVASVRIVGNAQVPTNVLTATLLLKNDSEFAQSLLNQDIERLRELYRKRGFFLAEIEGTAEVTEKSANIRYRIVEGPRARFGSLLLRGVEGSRAAVLHEALRFPAGAPFSQSLVDQMVATANTFYRIRRFLSCEIAPPSLSFHTETNRVDVTLEVNEGKRVEVRFEGNKRFNDKTLLKNMTLESLSAFGFRKAIADLTQFYLKEGYFQARIDPPQVVETDETIVLTFPVTEGERRYVREVRIEGNNAFSDRALRKRVHTRVRGVLRPVPLLGWFSSRGVFDPQTFDQDKRLLEVFYRAAGYRSAKVVGEAHLEDSNRKLVVTFRIQEGPRSVVRSIAVVGNTAIPAKTLLRLLSTKVNRPLDDEVVVGDRERIRTAYATQGYLYCDVPPPTFDADTGRLVYTVNEGKRVTVGAVTVRFLNENPKTRPHVVLREIDVKPGEPLNARKLYESQQRIFRLGLFRTVKMEPTGIYEGREIVDIPVLLRERNAGSINVGGGYSPSEGVRGTFEIVQRNLGGTGRRLGMKLRLGTLGNRYEITYVEPWTLWTPTKTTLRVFRDNLEEQDNTLTTGGLLNLSRTLYRFNQMAVQYRYQRFSLTRAASRKENGSILPTLSGLGVSFQRDTRDDLFNPKRGWFHELSLEVAGGMLGGESEFLKALSDTRVYRSIGGVVWATQARLGYSSRLGSEREVSSTERFRLGGSTTVRGYPERSFGEKDAYGNYRGNILFLASSELRIPLYRALGTALFVDSGNLWNRFKDVETQAPRVSVGAGVRVATPLGPARLDFAYPLNRLRDLPQQPRYWIALGNVF